jgi:hypothetical protein
VPYNGPRAGPRPGGGLLHRRGGNFSPPSSLFFSHLTYDHWHTACSARATATASGSGTRRHQRLHHAPHRGQKLWPQTRARERQVVWLRAREGRPKHNLLGCGGGLFLHHCPPRRHYAPHQVQGAAVRAEPGTNEAQTLLFSAPLLTSPPPSLGAALTRPAPSME